LFPQKKKKNSLAWQSPSQPLLLGKPSQTVGLRTMSEVSHSDKMAVSIHHE
jgi:hypothetical protein